jgi:hypothetical protein
MTLWLPTIRLTAKTSADRVAMRFAKVLPKDALCVDSSLYAGRCPVGLI